MQKTLLMRDFNYDFSCTINIRQSDGFGCNYILLSSMGANVNEGKMTRPDTHSKY